MFGLGLGSIILLVLGYTWWVVYLYPKAVLVRPVASGKGLTVPPVELFVLLLNAVLYILVIEARAACCCPTLLVATIVEPEYSELGVIPLP